MKEIEGRLSCEEDEEAEHNGEGSVCGDGEAQQREDRDGVIFRGENPWMKENSELLVFLPFLEVEKWMFLDWIWEL